NGSETRRVSLRSGQSQLQRDYQQLGDSLGKSLAIRPLVFGTIAIVPYALPIVNCELCIV
ncbi:MAG: hypothetical protein LBS10_02585, partial [Gracilibacteraceae bacterium]|nr:hypothetical protein [Gracilibacteraceae bacterium]